ncbi:DJ-1/PfpI family protein [Dactylosporangium sp. CS-047395]|uniref:DJ-1/PfpI family protein n=1 Tax=Dactylosporangium sp. CS-047395 TaxID=3239936 RepID=UPI003D8B5A97
MAAQRVVIAIFEGVQSLDVTGPLEVLAGANAAAGSEQYRVWIASIDGRPVRTSSGLQILPDGELAAAGPADLLIVPGGDGTRTTDPRLVAWLREHGPEAKRLAAVCTGAFLLAEAGLLDGRQVTTHWDKCATLARRFPSVCVDAEPIFVRDGNIWTSAGVTAGIDLALALVEEDHGRDVALGIARHLVMFLRRPGGQRLVLYPRMTALDIIGPYEVLSRLPGVSITFVGSGPDAVSADTGLLSLGPKTDFSAAAPPDVVVVPGGPDVAAQLADAELRAWLRSVDEHATWMASVCTGSLILAAAGLLRGRQATSHWLVADRLREFGAEPSPDRVVIDGRYATAAGVSAGIDLGLTLAARIAGPPVAQAIQLAVEYDPQPPFDAGSPRSAPPEIVEYLRTNSHVVVTS